MRIILSVLTLLFFQADIIAQKPTPAVELLPSGPKASFRGLSVVSDNIVWVSGSAGTVGRSLNGGKDWHWMTVKGFEKTDSRDIEAFDENTAVIMAVDAPAYILKTTDGGNNWTLVYKNEQKGMFLDAMEFWNDKEGIVVGDPIAGRFFIARTSDGGNTWNEVPETDRPIADSGEACFAASGTNIRSLKNNDYVLITGGLKSSIIIMGQKAKLPLIQGKESTGANSVAVWNHNEKNMVVVGGDFSKDTITANNCYYTNDGGRNWIAPSIPPHGYRSCVEYISKKELLACGTSGVDFTCDGGKTWSLLSKTSFHVCRKAKKGNAIFLAGGGGRLGKIIPVR
jgi:photosystem II stability/assembly factor-like uncharacterized protein